LSAPPAARPADGPGKDALSPAGAAEAAKISGAGLAAPSGPGNGPFTLAQGDYKPEVIYTVRPVYPHLARRRGIEGWVEVRFLVSRNGRVSKEEIVQARPEGVFENSALDALRAWRFAPGMIAGNTVDTWVVQIIRFKLTHPG
jgi:protein TonB